VFVTLSDNEFALLYTYLDREHSIDWDPNSIGQTTKLDRKLRAESRRSLSNRTSPCRKTRRLLITPTGWCRLAWGVARIIVVPTPGHDHARTSAQRIT
jgi:hypothetical protein